MSDADSEQHMDEQLEEDGGAPGFRDGQPGSDDEDGERERERAPSGNGDEQQQQGAGGGRPDTPFGDDEEEYQSDGGYGAEEEEEDYPCWEEDEGGMLRVPVAVYKAMHRELQLKKRWAEERAAREAKREAKRGSAPRKRKASRSPSPGAAAAAAAAADAAAAPWRASSGAPPPELTRALVEAEMMGVPSTTHPHLAALVASLITYCHTSCKPHPKNPVTLLYEATHRLCVNLEFAFEPDGAGFRAKISTSPYNYLYLPTPGRLAAKEALGLPFPGTHAAASMFGAAEASGASKREAKNAAASEMLDRVLAERPGIATLTWRQAVCGYPLNPEPWRADGGAPSGLTAAQEEERRVRLLKQKAARLEVSEAERRRKTERKQASWPPAAAPQAAEPRAAEGGEAEGGAEDVAGGGGPAPDGAAAEAGAGAAGAAAPAGGPEEPPPPPPPRPLFERHAAIMAARAPVGAPPPTAVAMLNQYAPLAQLELEFAAEEKGAGTAFAMYEVTVRALRRGEEDRQEEVAASTSAARSKRDARQQAAAGVMEQLLEGHEPFKRVATDEETGERARRAAQLRAQQQRARPVANARIDYSRPLAKHFRHGGRVEDADGVELLAPQRMRWGLGYGPAEAWQQQQQAVAPLPAQAAFLRFVQPAAAAGGAAAVPPAGAAVVPVVSLAPVQGQTGLAAAGGYAPPPAQGYPPQQQQHQQQYNQQQQQYNLQQQQFPQQYHQPMQYNQQYQQPQHVAPGPPQYAACAPPMY